MTTYAPASKLPIEILPLFQGGFEGKFDTGSPINGQVDTVVGKAFLFQRQLAQEMDGQKTLVLDQRTSWAAKSYETSICMTSRMSGIPTKTVFLSWESLIEETGRSSLPAEPSIL